MFWSKNNLNQENNKIVFSDNVYKDIKWYKNFQVDIIIFLSLVVIALSWVYLYSYKLNQESNISKLKKEFMWKYEKITAFNSTTSSLEWIKINNFNWDKVLKIIDYLEWLWLENYNLEFDEALRVYFVDIKWVELEFLDKLKSNTWDLLNSDKTFSTINIIENNTANLKLIFN